MSRRWTWITASFAILVALLAAASLLIDGPLRGIMERRLNANLQGYTAHLGAVDLHVLGFALDLEDLVIELTSTQAEAEKLAAVLTTV